MLKVAKIFQNSMILQREKPVRVWGISAAGETVTVRIQEKMASGDADANGNWIVELEPLEASESETLVIQNKDECLELQDVAIGEVWLAGGQSNMEFQMRYEKQIHMGNIPKNNARIRFYDVAEVCFEGQKEAFDYSAQEVWRKAEAKDLDYFSAVGYYFASCLEKELNVPIGIVGCNWGGTCAHAWMKTETVETVGKPWMDDYREKIKGIDWEQYWKRQLKNPINNRGNLFDPFSEFVISQTPTYEECKAFFKDVLHIDADNGPDCSVLTPQQVPGCLYEHMLKTVAPFGIRGFLWYQGESDDVDGCQGLYKDMLTGLIGDWRKLWKDGGLPFLLVQLPGFGYWMWERPHHYEIIRQCQQIVGETVEQTYVASISDAGEESDIHPKNKMVVGHRLALLAQNYVYGKKVPCEAPRFKNIFRNGRQIEIVFDYTYEGLQIGSEEAVLMGVSEQKCDAVAALKIYALNEEIEYDAYICGDKVAITLREDVEESLRVEFAYGSWYLVNLYNSAGLPAMPFMARC